MLARLRIAALGCSGGAPPINGSQGAVITVLVGPHCDLLCVGYICSCIRECSDVVTLLHILTAGCGPQLECSDYSWRETLSLSAVSEGACWGRGMFLWQHLHVMNMPTHRVVYGLHSLCDSTE